MKHKNDISLLILLSFLMQALVNQILRKSGSAEYFVFVFSAV